MSFLYPFYLWGLFGIGIPLIIHFFARKKGKALNFSSVRFLKISKTKAGKIKKIEEILILFMRISLLALLILILSGPISKSALFKGEGFFVFLIDDSLSMGAENSLPFKKLKERALEILSQIKKPACVSLLFLSGKYKGFSHDFESIGRIIKNSKVSFTSGNLFGCIEKAKKILEKKSGRKVIYFFTDMQKNLWNFDGEKIDLGDIEFVLIDCGKKNLSNISLKNIRIYPGKCECEILNWSCKEANGKIILSCGKWKKEKSFSVPPIKSDKIIFKIPEKIEKLKGEILYHDSILPDNSFYLSSPYKKRKILLIFEKPDKSNFYIINSIKAMEDGERFLIDEMRFDRIDNLIFERYGIIFICDVGRFRKDTIKRFYSYVEEGGNLVIFLGDTIIPQNFNNDWYLKEKSVFLTPATIKKKLEFRRPFKIVWVDTKNPLFSPFSEKIFEYLRPLNFFKIFHLDKIYGNVLLKIENGYCVMVEKEIGDGRVFLFPFLPQKNWTDFPLKSFFPVMIERILNTIHLKTFVLRIGEKRKIKVPGWVRKVEIFSPDGKKEEIKKIENNEIEFSPGIPGFWKVIFYKKGEKIEKIFGVNVDWKEGDLSRINFRSIKNLINGKIYFLNNKNLVIQRTTSKDLSDLFLDIALLLLLSEIAVSNFLIYKKRKNV